MHNILLMKEMYTDMIKNYSGNKLNHRMVEVGKYLSSWIPCSSRANYNQLPRTSCNILNISKDFSNLPEQIHLILNVSITYINIDLNRKEWWRVKPDQLYYLQGRMLLLCGNPTSSLQTHMNTFNTFIDSEQKSLILKKDTDFQTTSPLPM